MNGTIDERGTLGEGEHHPAAYEALRYVQSLPLATKAMHMEAFSSCAIEGNRLGEVCAATLDRIMKGEGVGERYILGLAWTIRYGEIDKEGAR